MGYTIDIVLRAKSITFEQITMNKVCGLTFTILHTIWKQEKKYPKKRMPSVLFSIIITNMHAHTWQRAPFVLLLILTVCNYLCRVIFVAQYYGRDRERKKRTYNTRKCCGFHVCQDMLKDSEHLPGKVWGIIRNCTESGPLTLPSPPSLLCMMLEGNDHCNPTSWQRGTNT